MLGEKINQNQESGTILLKVFKKSKAEFSSFLKDTSNTFRMFNVFKQ